MKTGNVTRLEYPLPGPAFRGQLARIELDSGYGVRVFVGHRLVQSGIWFDGHFEGGIWNTGKVEWLSLDQNLCTTDEDIIDGLMRRVVYVLRRERRAPLRQPSDRGERYQHR